MLIHVSCFQSKVRLIVHCRLHHAPNLNQVKLLKTVANLLTTVKE